LVWVPRNLCAAVPQGVTAEQAAFATLGAIALHGVRQAGIQVGETVAVIGLGVLGLLTTGLLAASGCLVLAADPDRERAALGQGLGARAVAPPGEGFRDLVARHTERRGADAVIITAGTDSNAPIVEAGIIARDRARVVIVGAVPADVPRSPFYEKEIDVRFSRSYGPGRYDRAYEEGGQDYPIGYVRWTEQRNLAAFLELVQAGKLNLDSLVTHRFPISNALDAYAVVTNRSEPSLGVLITYPEEPNRNRRRPAVRAVVGIREGSIGLGLIGAGSFARNVLLPAIVGQPGVSLMGVVTSSGLTARAVADRYRFAYAASDEAEVFTDREVHGVIIATRHHLHASQVLAALAVGKHVFVEKPLCLTSGELDKILEAHRAASERFGERILMVGFNRRFAPGTAKLRALLAGRVGPVHLHYRINAGHIPSESWVHDPMEGGGRWLGEGCHFVDLANYLVGAALDRVHGEASPEDSVEAMLRYRDGSVATIAYLSQGHPALPKERIEILGNGSVLTLDDFMSVEWHTPGDTGRETAKRQDKGHRAEIKAFLGALREGGQLPISLIDLSASTRATILVQDAIRTGTPQPLA
jgi:predicted dehydrogenase